jgi:hypothetical protein
MPAEPPPPPSPEESGTPPAPYSLPGPLSQRDPLPVAPGAPRIPRALRAFNGTRPASDDAPPAPRRRSGPARSGARDALTIRDLLESPDADGAAEEGRFTALRNALSRLRR